MGNRLTTPINIPVTNQVLSRWSLILVRNPDSNKTLDSANTRLNYTVSDLHEDGDKTERARTNIFMGDWPPAMRAAIRTLHDMIVQHAETSGVFDPGTVTEDISP